MQMSDGLTHAETVWTNEMCDELTRLWRGGWSKSLIAEKLGVKPGAVFRRAMRLGLRDDNRKIIHSVKPVVTKRPESDSWDEKVFETYAARKARLAAERVST